MALNPPALQAFKSQRSLSIGFLGKISSHLAVNAFSRNIQNISAKDGQTPHSASEAKSLPAAATARHGNVLLLFFHLLFFRHLGLVSLVWCCRHTLSRYARPSTPRTCSCAMTNSQTQASPFGAWASSRPYAMLPTFGCDLAPTHIIRLKPLT